MLKYISGKGFESFTPDENREMAKLGIGQPPQTYQEPVKEVVEQQQFVPQQQTQVNPQQSYKSDDEIKRQTEDYFNRAGVTEQKPVVEQTPVAAETNDDVFGSWFDTNDTNTTPRTEQEDRGRVEPTTQSVDDGGIMDYRKSIVASSIKLGADPSKIEQTIASFTPEDLAIFANIKLGSDTRMTNGSTSQPAGPQQPVNRIKEAVSNAMYKRQASPNVASIPSSNGVIKQTDNSNARRMQELINKQFRG